MKKEDADRELREIHDVRKLRAIERLRTGYRELTNELLAGTYIGRELLRDKCKISMTHVVTFFPLVEALERDLDPAEAKPEPIKPGSSPDPLSPRVSAAFSNVRTALTAVSDCVVAELASIRSEDFIRLEAQLVAQKTDYERRLLLSEAIIADLETSAAKVVGESDENASSADSSLDLATKASAERDDIRGQLHAALTAHAMTAAKLDAAQGQVSTATQAADQLAAQLRHMSMERAGLLQAAERAATRETMVQRLQERCGSLQRENDYLRSTIDSAFGRRGEPR